MGQLSLPIMVVRSGATKELRMGCYRRSWDILVQCCLMYREARFTANFFFGGKLRWYDIDRNFDCCYVIVAEGVLGSLGQIRKLKFKLHGSGVAAATGNLY
jgi:hypothetical protein